MLVMLATIGAAGCFASREAGKPFPSSARRELVVNWTTKREVEKLFGPPLATTTVSEGQERWTYEHTRVSARRLLPFTRDVTVSQTPYEQLFLTFRSSVLTDCTYVAEAYRTENNLIVPAGTIREPCGR